MGSVDSASIGSQANYGRSHCLRYIIRWRSEVSFSSLRFREYDQLFVADAVFEGKSGRKRKREDGQRRCAPSCRGVPSLLSSSGNAPPFDTLLVRFSTEVSFAEKRAVGYMNVGKRCRSGPAERKLWQLSTDESNRSSLSRFLFSLLEAHSLLIYKAKIRNRAFLRFQIADDRLFDEIHYNFSIIFS